MFKFNNEKDSDNDSKDKIINIEANKESQNHNFIRIVYLLNLLLMMMIIILMN